MSARLHICRLVIVGIALISGMGCETTPNEEQHALSGPELERTIQSHIDRGIQLGEQGRFNQAIREFDQIVKLDPGNVDAYNNLAVAYFRKGDMERAIENLSLAIDNGQNDAETYFFRGLIYGKHLGQDANAIPDLSKAIELNPTYKRAYLNRGLGYQTLGQFDEAIADYTTLMELDPSDAKLVLDRRAELYLKTGRFDEAWEDARRAESLGIALKPELLEEIRKASGHNR
jgi:tetratricopeptide (TPR) repeat protein